jgi:hypothetical protein
VLLGFAQTAERPFDPWTFLLDEWLNFSQREPSRHNYLDAVRVDQDSRMQSAI